MKIIVAGNIAEDICLHLKRLNFEVYKSPFCKDVLTPLAYHPDMQAAFSDGTLVCEPSLFDEYSKITAGANTKILKGTARVHSNYPADVAYNIKVVGNKVFHNFKYTDSTLAEILKDKEKISVTQGYSGCSICKVGDNAIITADNVIYDRALGTGINSLKITPGEVSLPGFDVGFIGGASFNVGRIVYFFGDVNNHSKGKEITDFCRLNGCDVVCLGNGQLTDYGSAIVF